MTWTYDQAAGVIRNGAGVWEGHGYSGNAKGLNNPEMEAVPFIGPIPRQGWKIVAWHDIWEDKGPVVAQLQPVGRNAYGRNGFLIHGPHVNDKNDSSDGCIVTARTIREAWRASGDMDIEVIWGNNNEPIS